MIHVSLKWTILYFFPMKQKFEDRSKDCEVFVVAPSTAPLNSVLVDCFAGEIKKIPQQKIICCTLDKTQKPLFRSPLFN